MTNGQVLDKAVRAWVTEVLPGDAAAAERAAYVARSAYEHGASVGAACDEARSFVGSWVRHPSYAGPHARGGNHDATLPLAS